MRVAVVILNWNGRSFLEKFLGNVVEHSRDHATVYVADNGSTDGSVEYVIRHHPEVRVVSNGENLGYAGGYNRALESIEEPYAVLLNSDVEVTAGWLVPLIALMDGNGRIAACQPKLLDFNDRRRFEYAGASGGFIDRLGYPFCRGRIFNVLEMDAAQYDDARPVFWASGACLFIRMSAFRQVGGLDSDFFAHMEEVDLCWRLQRNGHAIWVEPRSKVFHVGGGTLHKSNPRKTYLNFRNGLVMLLKNLSLWTALVTIPSRMVLDWVASMKFIADGQSQDALAVWRAHLSFLRMIPNVWKKRSGAYPSVHGIYPGSIVLRHFVLGLRSFSPLNWMD